MPLTTDVGKNISILRREHPEWAMRQVVAAAINAAKRLLEKRRRRKKKKRK